MSPRSWGRPLCPAERGPAQTGEAGTPPRSCPFSTPSGSRFGKGPAARDRYGVLRSAVGKATSQNRGGFSCFQSRRGGECVTFHSRQSPLQKVHPFTSACFMMHEEITHCKHKTLDTPLLHSQSQTILTGFEHTSSYIRDIFCCSEIAHWNKLL